jgi:hypothetical protein
MAYLHNKQVNESVNMFNNITQFPVITSKLHDITLKMNNEFNAIYSDMCEKNVIVANVKNDIIKISGTIREQQTIINTLEDVCTEFKNITINQETKMDRLDSLEKKVEEQGIIIKQQDATIKQQDATIKQQDVTITELKEIIVELKETIKEQKLEILELKCDKFVNNLKIAIQDLNSTDELEKKFSDPFKKYIRSLRFNRNNQCHYIDVDDSIEIINKKKEILLNTLENIPNEYKEDLDVEIDNELLIHIKEYLSGCVVYSEVSARDIKKIVRFWK